MSELPIYISLNLHRPQIEITNDTSLSYILSLELIQEAKVMLLIML